MAIPILGDLIDGVKDIVSEVVVDKDKRDQVNLELRRLEDQAQARIDAQIAAQIEVNKVEAASSSVLVAGWRPAVGWICAVALAYSFILMPFMAFFARVTFDYTGEFPSIDMDAFLYVLLGMLGIGGMRTFEKVKGVASNDYTVQPAPKVVTPTVTVDTEKGAVTVATTPVPEKKKKGWKLF